MHLICGINPVLEALSARERHFDRLLVVKGLRNRRVSEAIARASQIGVPLRFEARETLDRMAGGVPHQGLIAVVSAKPMLSLEELVDQARPPALLVVLDGVEDPRNLGAIVRTAEAAGADGVVLPERHSAGLSETVARASAGALEHVKVAQIGNVAQALDRLKQRGVWVVGFDASGTERWDGVDFRRPVALVLGGEGRGIRRLVRERCDHLVSLPLFGHVGSLNVSVAAGVALYEVVRQRGAVPSQVRPIPPRALAAPPRVVGPAPDDAEGDPGRLGREFAAAPGEDEGDAASEHEGPLVVLGDEESAWWGSPSAAPADGNRPRRPHAPHAEQSRRPDAGAPPAHGPRRDRQGHGRGEPRGGGGVGPRGRRRHRGRPRPPGPPGGASPSPPADRAEGSVPPPPAHTAPADTPGGGDQPVSPARDASAGPGPAGGAGRRRRRRRRR
jgi:23S rRNA (guanosine2251-2'-O)-methyltransferase